MSVAAGGEHAPACACESRATVQGVGFRPYVLQARHRARPGRLRAERRARSARRGGGRRQGVDALQDGFRRGRRRWRRSRTSAYRSAAGTPTTPGSRSSRACVRRRSRRAWSRPTRRPATTASPSCSTPRTAASAIRSSTARTAARASRSCAACRTTAPLTTMAGFEMCPACRREYDDPARSPLPRAADCLPGVRAAWPGCWTRRPTGRPPSRATTRRGGRARPARRADRRRQGRRRLPSRLRRRRRGAPWPTLRSPQAPRGQALRADGRRTARPRRHWCELGADELAPARPAARGRS